MFIDAQEVEENLRRCIKFSNQVESERENEDKHENQYRREEVGVGFPLFHDEKSVDCLVNTLEKCHERKPGGQMVERQDTILYLLADEIEEEHPRRRSKFSHENVFTERQNQATDVSAFDDPHGTLGFPMYDEYEYYSSDQDSVN